MRPEGSLLVERKQSYVFTLANGRQIKGQDLVEDGAWPWREHPWEPRVRYECPRTTSPTYGKVSMIIAGEPGQEHFYLLCVETMLSAPQLIQRWRRHTWIEFVLLSPSLPPTTPMEA